MLCACARLIVLFDERNSHESIVIRESGFVYSRFTIYDSRLVMRLPSLKRFLMDYLLCAFEAGLVLVAWGDVREFLSNSARAGMIIVLLLVPFITIWGKSER